ncbi:MAG TPA: hypothetical protein VLA60_04450 [Nitrospirales bacterium]|nr:hypothetical protein [Nitrospirales bacterium]
MNGVSRWFLLPVVFLVGCAGMFQGSLHLLEDERDRQEVFQALRQKESTIRTLRGLFQASISGSGVPLSQNVLGTVSYVHPDVLDLKTFIRMGVPVMNFHRKGNEYELNLPGEDKVITGRLDEPQERSRWDHTVMLSLRALDAMLGKVSRGVGEEARVWKNNEHYRIDLAANPSSSTSSQDDFTVRTWVDAQTMDLTSIEYRRSFDDIVVFVECEDYREVKVTTGEESAPVRLPFLVRATDYRPSGGSITLHFKEFIVNAAS